MKTYEVRYTVDGKSGCSVVVQAKDVAMAKRVALGQIMGMPGYAGCRIVITGIAVIG